MDDDYLAGIDAYSKESYCLHILNCRSYEHLKERLVDQTFSFNIELFDKLLFNILSNAKKYAYLDLIGRAFAAELL